MNAVTTHGLRRTGYLPSEPTQAPWTEGFERVLLGVVDVEDLAQPHQVEDLHDVGADTAQLQLHLVPPV